MNAGDADPSGLSVVAHGDRLVLSGDLVVWALGRLPRAHEAVQIDLEGVTRMDTAGAWELAQRRAAGATLTGLSDHHTRLIDTVTQALPVPQATSQPPARWRRCHWRKSARGWIARSIPSGSHGNRWT